MRGTGEGRVWEGREGPCRPVSVCVCV